LSLRQCGANGGRGQWEAGARQQTDCWRGVAASCLGPVRRPPRLPPTRLAAAARRRGLRAAGAAARDQGLERRLDVPGLCPRRLSGVRAAGAGGAAAAPAATRAAAAARCLPHRLQQPPQRPRHGGALGRGGGRLGQQAAVGAAQRGGRRGQRRLAAGRALGEAWRAGGRRERVSKLTRHACARPQRGRQHTAALARWQRLLAVASTHQGREGTTHLAAPGTHPAARSWTPSRRRPPPGSPPAPWPPPGAREGGGFRSGCQGPAAAAVLPGASGSGATRMDRGPCGATAAAPSTRQPPHRAPLRSSPLPARAAPRRCRRSRGHAAARRRSPGTGRPGPARGRRRRSAPAGRGRARGRVGSTGPGALLRTPLRLEGARRPWSRCTRTEIQTLPPIATCVKPRSPRSRATRRRPRSAPPATPAGPAARACT
jgi:hypothetical protein